ASKGVSIQSMKKLIAIILVTAGFVANTATAACYSTEATMTRIKDKGTYEVNVRVSELSERGGKSVEEIIARPRITSAPGVPASLYSGLEPKDAKYKKKE